MAAWLSTAHVRGTDRLDLFGDLGWGHLFQIQLRQDQVEVHLELHSKGRIDERIAVVGSPQLVRLGHRRSGKLQGHEDKRSVLFLTGLRVGPPEQVPGEVEDVRSAVLKLGSRLAIDGLKRAIDLDRIALRGDDLALERLPPCQLALDRGCLARTPRDCGW